MSIAGILSSSLFQTNSAQNNYQQQIKKEFQQLGQDLQAGNLTQAQADFATLTASQPAGSNSANPSARAFSTLGQDLQSGNPSAAQQAFSTIQQSAQSGGRPVHHHHHAGGARNSEPASAEPHSSVAQALSALGQDLQSGNLSAAQQAFSSFQQTLQMFALNGGSGSSSAASGTTGRGLSVTA